MTDKEIKELFNIPHATLWTWKKGTSTEYKKKLYNFLRAMTKEEAEAIFKRINIKKDK